MLKICDHICLKPHSKLPVLFWVHINTENKLRITKASQAVVRIPKYSMYNRLHIETEMKNDAYRISARKSLKTQII
jgi:DsbC/DsbD-like thiol-disulfide interchange protein